MPFYYTYLYLHLLTLTYTYLSSYLTPTVLSSILLQVIMLIFLPNSLGTHTRIISYIFAAVQQWAVVSYG